MSWYPNDCSHLDETCFFPGRITQVFEQLEAGVENGVAYKKPDVHKPLSCARTHEPARTKTRIGMIGQDLIN